jgi:hypothetical protein
MERVIDVFSSHLRQPSNPFTNLAAQAQKMAYVNAMLAMCPSFNKVKDAPLGSIDLQWISTLGSEGKLRITLSHNSAGGRSTQRLLFWPPGIQRY